MKTTPSIEAARKYLTDFIIMPLDGGEGDWTLLNRKHRLWLCKNSGKSIAHICTPTKLLHYIRGDTERSSTFWKSRHDDFIGPIVDGAHWHTDRICYKCQNCGKMFEGGIAFAIRVGIRDKEKLT